jgi:hypothetical protein
MLPRVIHFIYLSLYSLFLIHSPSSSKANDNYILIEFSDDHTEKPVPVVIFSTDSFYTDERWLVGYSFRVNWTELNKIENVAKNNCSYLLLDTLAYRYYSVNVVRNGQKKIYGTINRNETRKLFGQIITALNDRKDTAAISKAFAQVSYYLHPRQ